MLRSGILHSAIVQNAVGIQCIAGVVARQKNPATIVGSGFRADFADRAGQLRLIVVAPGKMRQHQIGQAD